MNFNLFSNLVNPLAGDSASAWQDIVNKVTKSVDSILGSLSVFVGLAAFVMTVIHFIKGGFTSNPSKRKASLSALGFLWLAVVACIIAWILRGSIINFVAGAAPTPGPGSFFNFLTIS